MTATGLTTKFLVDDDNPTGYAQVVEELTGTSTAALAVTRSYTYGYMLISQNPLISGAWSPSFYGTDGHGSVRFLTSTAGTVTDAYDYDAFGILIHQSGSTQNVYLYSGEQFDPDLGLYYQRARYLNAFAGRFWTIDSYRGSLRQPPSLHRYLYVGGDPVNYRDPTGKEGLIDSLQTIAIQAQLYILSVPTNVLAAFGAGGTAVGLFFNALGARITRVPARG